MNQEELRFRAAGADIADYENHDGRDAALPRLICPEQQNVGDVAVPRPLPSRAGSSGDCYPGTALNTLIASGFNREVRRLHLLWSNHREGVQAAFVRPAPLPGRTLIVQLSYTTKKERKQGPFGNICVAQAPSPVIRAPGGWWSGGNEQEKHTPAPEARKSLAQARKPWVIVVLRFLSPVGGDTCLTAKRKTTGCNTIPKYVFG